MNTHYLLRQGGWLDDDLPIHTQLDDSPTRNTKVKGNTPIELSTQGNIDDSVTVGWYKLSDPEDIPTFPSISLLTHEGTLSTKRKDTLSTERKDTLSTKRKDRFKRTGKYNRWNNRGRSAEQNTVPTLCSDLIGTHPSSKDNSERIHPDSVPTSSERPLSDRALLSKERSKGRIIYILSIFL